MQIVKAFSMEIATLQRETGNVWKRIGMFGPSAGAMSSLGFADRKSLEICLLGLNINRFKLKSEISTQKIFCKTGHIADFLFQQRFSYRLTSKLSYSPLPDISVNSLRESCFQPLTGSTDIVSITLRSELLNSRTDMIGAYNFVLNRTQH